MIGEQKREMVFTITANTEDVLVLFLGEWRVFGVGIFHDIGDLFGIKAAIKLEPNNSTMNSAKIAIRPEFRGEVFEYLILIKLKRWNFYGDI
jgi:hypothetical protein